MLFYAGRATSSSANNGCRARCKCTRTSSRRRRAKSPSDLSGQHGRGEASPGPRVLRRHHGDGVPRAHASATTRSTRASSFVTGRAQIRHERGDKHGDPAAKWGVLCEYEARQRCCLFFSRCTLRVARPSGSRRLGLIELAVSGLGASGLTREAGVISRTAWGGRGTLSPAARTPSTPSPRDTR